MIPGILGGGGGGEPGEVVPYICYTGMCRPEGMVFELFPSENWYRF